MFDLRYLVSFSRKIDKVRQGCTHTSMLNHCRAVNGPRGLTRRFAAAILRGSWQGVRNFKDVPRNITSVASRFSHAYRFPSELRPNCKNFPTLTHKVKQHFQALTLAVRTLALVVVCGCATGRNSHGPTWCGHRTGR